MSSAIILPSGQIIARVRLFLALWFVLIFAGCASNAVRQAPENYLDRATTQRDQGVVVTSAVLSPKETDGIFGEGVSHKKIQPIWLEIENTLNQSFYLMLLSIDPDYFAPSEVAWMMRHDESGQSLVEKIDFYLDKHIPVIIPPRSTVSGFAYTNLTPGAKAYAVELFTKDDSRYFEFVSLVPGFEADYMRVNFNELYPEQEVKDLSQEDLKSYLETLPCCVLGEDNKTNGDPLNLVIVGEGPHLLSTLVRRGWHLTETTKFETSWKTVMSSVFGGIYKTSPVSPLYLFDRQHDAAMQKARGNVNQRNHLRLWKAPVTYEGKPVWVGQISRDIGIRMSSKTLVTHKIDPVVDEARLYIALDLIASGTLRSIGYVKGVGYADQESPSYNFTGDPYYTDGKRVVLFQGDRRINLEQIHYLRWEPMEIYRTKTNTISLQPEKEE